MLGRRAEVGAGRLPPDPVDLVTAFHAIEHLDVETPLATPNAGDLRRAACGFYQDPAHCSPLPPALTDYLVSGSGFEVEVQVRSLHPSQSPLLPGACAGQQVEQLLSVTRHGPQDYAVLGHQSQPAERA